jgi:hypothetical protein
MDTVLITQWIYYTARDATKRRKDGYDKKVIVRSALYVVVFVLLIAMITNHIQSAGTESITTVSKTTTTRRMGRKLMAIDYTDLDNLDDDFIFGDDDPGAGFDDGWPPKGPKAITGYVIGIVSASFYLGSRIPQIFKK